MVQRAQICFDAIAVVQHASCGSAATSLKAAQAGLEGTVAAMQKAGGEDVEKYETVCSRMLLALEQDAAKLDCTLPIDPDLRSKMVARVDKYFSQQLTPVTKTGDAAADELIAKVAAMRDAACACKDQTCLDKLEVPTMPPALPAAARDLVTKLLDDAARCSQRIGLHQ
jgi:hypothetical protein